MAGRTAFLVCLKFLKLSSFDHKTSKYRKRQTSEIGFVFNPNISQADVFSIVQQSVSNHIVFSTKKPKTRLSETQTRQNIKIKNADISTFWKTLLNYEKL